METNNSDKKIKSYKGFDKELQCRGFQYEVGKEYEQDGEITCCTNGFHACENPFDVLDYYNINNGSRFCEVEQSGAIDRKVNDTKIASSKIKIKAEISVIGLFKTGIEWIKELTNPQKLINHIDCDKKSFIQIGSGGDHAEIGSCGSYVQIGSSGDYVKIGSSGYSAKIGSSGKYVQIGSSEDSARIGSSGYSAKIGSSGDYAQIGSSGDYVKIGSRGNFAYIGSSGDSDQIVSSGTCSQIASSGNNVCIGSSSYLHRIGSSGQYAKIGSIGRHVHIGSSGDYAKIASSGYCSKIGSSGDCAHIDSTGEKSVICCSGTDSVVKAKKGSWITLSEWKYSGDRRHSIPICVKTEYVDGERIKADTWYKLKNGEFVEVEL